MRSDSSCSYRARVKACLLTLDVSEKRALLQMYYKRYCFSRLLVHELLKEPVRILCSNKNYNGNDPLE
jgi:hypothetical protein